MSKVLQGKVISNKMTNTAIVEVERLVPHALYKKLLRRNKKFKVETFGKNVEVGEIVKIIEVKPISKDKHFALFGEEKKNDIKHESKSEVKTETKPEKQAVKKQKKEKKA